MINIYMQDAEICGDSKKEELAVMEALDDILSGRITTDAEGCVWPVYEGDTLKHGMLLTLDGNTSLRIKPVLNAHGTPELSIMCCTDSSFRRMYGEWNYQAAEEEDEFPEDPVYGFSS